MLRPSNASCCSHVPQLQESLKCVEVKAPATLQEGYVFWASLGELSFPVQVPSGGVRSGQVLRVPLVDSLCTEHKGRWKDGLFSCFRFGLFHPHVCNAWLCPQVLLVQVLTRMKLTWLAKPTSSKWSLQSSLRKLFFCLIAFSLYDAFFAPPLFEVIVNENGDVNFLQNPHQRWHQLAYIFLSLPMSIYGAVIVIRLRVSIRVKYGIPAGSLGRLEDCCCVCFCNCCVLSQMARQTADYDDEQASWCSPLGTDRALAVKSEEGLPVMPV